MADFIFRVESVKLTPDQENKLAAAIQGAVLAELAQLDLHAPSSTPECLFRPIHWYGGLLIKPEALQSAVGTTLSVTAKTGAAT